jgi:twitching motility protein PilT
LNETLKTLIDHATERGASDLHLEPGLPAAIRVRGKLQVAGDPLLPRLLMQMARGICPEEKWNDFLRQNSCDFSRNLGGTQCRVNVLQTVRGVGMAIRLLLPVEPTLRRLNLNPDLLKVFESANGLVLFSGPTGCGKSSTMAAMIQETNLRRALHVITIESPIEYYLKPHLCYIRQREVGRDTPSFYQGLLDTLREDPDLVMIGELRDTETMQATLNAAETGHLVFATVHSGSSVEAIQRLVASFPSQAQDGVRAALADCLVAVVCQRMIFRPEMNLRVPECEILFCNQPAKSVIRQGSLKNLHDIMQTGLKDSMWTFERYRSWLDQKTDWFLPGKESDHEGADRALQESSGTPAVQTRPMPSISFNEKDRIAPSAAVVRPRGLPAEAPGVTKGKSSAEPGDDSSPGVIEIDTGDDLDSVLNELKKL